MAAGDTERVGVSASLEDLKPLPKEAQDENCEKWTPQVRWLDLVAIAFVHFGALFGLILLLTQASLPSFLYCKLPLLCFC